jgi:peptidoglycan-N-acetylglucosamine deacetylase
LNKIGKVDYDPSLAVPTSSRRIKKPAIVVFGELLRNCGGVLKYFGRSVMAGRKTVPAKVRSTRFPARFLVFIPLLAAGVFIYGYFAPGSQVFGKVWFKEGTPHKVIALTFDDGPNEPYTSEILAILQSYNATATFFAVGKNVELYPDVARQIVANGNALENHTYSHSSNHALTGEGYNDVALAQQAIANVTGVIPHIYRPPHGRKSPWELRTIGKDGLQTVTWSDTANDQHVYGYWGTPNPQEYAKQIVAKANPGGIILMHDGYGLQHNNAKSDKSLTVEALPLIIEGLQKQGYQLVTVPQLLHIPAYNN